MLRSVGFFILLLLLLSSHVFAGDRLMVYTVNYPLAYFAERIGGEQVVVVFPAPPNIDPAYWMPGQATITAYQQADLILLNGANYAKWVAKVSLPRGKIVVTSRKFKERYIYTTDVTTHSHGSAGGHAHESLAFTTWLDLSLAKLQADAIYRALLQKRPASEMQYKENYKSLVQDLESLDAQIKAIVSKNPGRLLIGSHPVYDYLSKGYGINMQSVHWEPKEVLGVSQWNGLLDVLKTHPAKHMLWEARPLAQSVSQLNESGLMSIVFSPCANKPTEGDFLSVMQDNVEGLEAAYR